MSPTLDTAEQWRLIDQERVRVGDLLEGLDDDQWRQPSLCEGWTVRDVAGHLASQHRTGMPSVLVAAVRARFDQDRMIHDAAVRHARRPTDVLVQEVRALVGHRGHMPVITPLEVLTDLLVHARDITEPLGIYYPFREPAAVAVADRIWDAPRHLRRAFRAQERMAGRRLVATDTTWSVGEGQEVRGTIDDLVLLLAARPVVRDRLAGPGLRGLDAG